MTKAMDEKTAKIAAAKAPVADYMAKRLLAEQAIANLDAGAAPAIAALVEARGEGGPFRFGDQVVTFRKHPQNGSWLVLPYAPPKEREIV